MIVTTMKNAVMTKLSVSVFALALTVLGDGISMSRQALSPKVTSMRFLVAVNHTWEKKVARYIVTVL